jgi:hypothetical protein
VDVSAEPFLGHFGIGGLPHGESPAQTLGVQVVPTLVMLDHDREDVGW